MKVNNFGVLGFIVFMVGVLTFIVVNAITSMLSARDTMTNMSALIMVGVYGLVMFYIVNWVIKTAKQIEKKGDENEED